MRQPNCATDLRVIRYMAGAINHRRIMYPAIACMRQIVLSSDKATEIALLYRAKIS